MVSVKHILFESQLAILSIVKMLLKKLSLVIVGSDSQEGEFPTVTWPLL